MRLRPKRSSHTWVYDAIEDRTCDGRRFGMLNMVDASTRECVCIRIDRKLSLAAVIDVLADLLITWGTPGRSLEQWAGVRRRNREGLNQLLAGQPTSFPSRRPRKPGGKNPWKNSYIESFDGKLRHELLGCEA